MLRLVEITSAETGWKGDWYKVGQRYWVDQQPKWPRVYANRWLVAESGFRIRGINEADCKTVIGPWRPRAWLRSLTEPHLDNTTSSGRLMLNITGAMAQFERDQIVDRTRRGMAELRRRGMWIGRKPKVSDAIARKMLAMRRRGKSGEEIARHFRKLKVKPSTVYARTNALLRKNSKK